MVHEGPFQREVSQILKLRNPHNYPVAFKVSLTTLHTSTTGKPETHNIFAGQNNCAKAVCLVITVCDAALNFELTG